MAKLKIIKNWERLSKSKMFLFNLGASLILFSLALLLVKKVGLYAETLPSPALPDFLHSLFPPINVIFLATFGFLAVQLIFWLYFILWRPDRLPYALRVYAVFLIFRSVFIFATNFGAPAARIDDIPLLNFLFSGLYFTKDLFPSGHTALPFLGYLIIKDKFLKYFMLFWSIVMGASVIMLHVHYTIDVLGAFFVSYGAVGLHSWVKKEIVPLLNYALVKMSTALSSPKAKASS